MKPNILIFMTDQEQASVTLPDHPCRTPHLDRFAEQGIRFTAAYPPMAHCCPARASFMTGLYPTQHGIYNNVLNDQALNKGLHEGVETFSERLAQSGYRMIFTGKWHVTAEEDPVDRGWEQLEVKNSGVRGDYNGIRRERYRLKDGEFAKTDRERGQLLRPGWGSFRLYGTSPKSYEETDDYRIVGQAKAKLEELKTEADPWCMYVGVSGPHDPFIIPEKYARMYDPAEVELPANYHDDLADKPAIYRRMRKTWSQLTEDEVKESIAHYWGYCSMVDDLFGEVLDQLEKTGQLDNTMVIFLSDHGEHAGAHGLYYKGISHFDEGYRVPCVIRWPQGVSNAGRTVDSLISLMDLAPTFIDAAEAEPLKVCSGRSLLPFLRDVQPESWRQAIYIQCNGVEIYYMLRAVRTSRYKFVYNPTDIDELYDLEKDPYEMHNVAEVPEMQEVKRQMNLLMWELAYESEDMIFNHYPPNGNAELGPAIYGDGVSIHRGLIV
jgi:arylsulfatase A-like enzyme